MVDETEPVFEQRLEDTPGWPPLRERVQEAERMQEIHLGDAAKYAEMIFRNEPSMENLQAEMNRAIEAAQEEMHRQMSRSMYQTEVDRINHTVTLNYEDLEARAMLRAPNPEEAARNRVRDLERQYHHMRGRSFGNSRRHLERDLYNARQEYERIRREADSEARRRADDAVEESRHRFNPSIWGPQELPRARVRTAPAPRAEYVFRNDDHMWSYLNDTPAPTQRVPDPENITDHERRRREVMSNDGHKVHLTTRDGYKKTIRIPGTIGDTISIPEQVRGAAATGGLTNPSIIRRDFRVTRKAVYLDMTDGGAETREYWAVENG